jgi:hypothetical protein
VKFLLLALVFALGCTSDLRRVADANALQVYQKARYDASCVAVVGPASCAEWAKANDDLMDEVTLCNTTRHVGNLPKVAKKRLAAFAKKVEAQQ